MSIKKRMGVVIASVPILLILATVTILLNNRNNNVNASEEDWTNIGEVSDEFLEEYFDEYRVMREEVEPENILMVTSKTRPETYGAVKVVEAPNYLYMLQYEDSVTRDAAFESLQKDGVTVEKNQIYTLTGDLAEADKKATIKERAYRTMGTDDEEGDDEYLSWGIKLMELDWVLNTMGDLSELPEVTVAVIDSGMDESDFRDHFPDREISYHCVVECGAGMIDGVATKHGTHVGGTVTEGTLDNVHLLAIKATFNAAGSLANSDIITAINYAVSQNVDVINMSLGGPGYDTSMNNALQAAEDVGIISVASAGNDNVSTLYYPASYDNTVSVAALQICDDDEECVVERWLEAEPDPDTGITYGSNYGEKIDFAAPGAMVLGINGYYMSGTSMASPHIAAIMANFKSLNPELTRADAKELLKRYSLNLGDEGWDEYYGFGIPYFDYIPGYCREYDCDEYGVFASDWFIATNGLGNAFKTDAVKYRLRNDSIQIISTGHPVIVMAKIGDEFTRIEPTDIGVEGMRKFSFEGYDPMKANIHMEYVGDVTMDGNVNVLDLAKVKRSILLPTSINYQALTNKAKVMADLTLDGNVNVLDLAKIKRSILLPTSVNYLPLEW